MGVILLRWEVSTEATVTLVVPVNQRLVLEGGKKRTVFYPIFQVFAVTYTSTIATVYKAIFPLEFKLFVFTRAEEFIRKALKKKKLSSVTVNPLTIRISLKNLSSRKHTFYFKRFKSNWFSTKKAPTNSWTCLFSSPSHWIMSLNCKEKLHVDQRPKK